MKSCRYLKSDKTSLIPFLFYHIAVFSICLIVCLVAPRTAATDFMDIIPDNGISPVMKKAEDAFTENQDRSVVFYIGSDSKEKSVRAVEALILELEKTGLMESISKGTEEFNLSAMQDFISENSMYLLDDKTIKQINADPRNFAYDSLSRIFGAFTMSSLENLDEDPFLLSENVWMNYLTEVSSLTSLSPDNGYLTAEYDEKVWIALNCLFNRNAISVANSDSIYRFFSVCDKIQETFEDCEIVYSGIPLHSAESAASSQKEIALISVVSLAVMLIIFLLSCKNLQIIKLFLTSLCLSLLSAISVLLIFFREFHVMTLLFGTTIMGTCIDYSIHFYVRYSKKNGNESGADVCRSLKKSLSVGFGSTAICYVMILFSDYMILKQIAVFSTAGLVSSFLTTICLYPNSVKPKMITKGSFVSSEDRKLKMPSCLIYFFALFSTVLLFFSLSEVKIENNIMSLYKPSDRLLKCESRASEILGYQSTSYAVVSAESETELSEKENAITKSLDVLVEQGKLDGYVATTKFIPSVSNQKKSLEAVRKLIPYLDEQGLILEINQDRIDAYRNRIMSDAYITADNLPEEIRGLISNVSPGRIDDLYCNVILFRNAKDNEEIKSVFNGYENCHYFQTAVDIGTQLDELSKTIMKLIVLAFLLILIALFIIFGIKEGFRMCLAPYCIVSLTVSVSWMFGYPIDFFYVVGLILSIGLGLDYMVFASEKGKNTSSKAVLLSFLTTELSFGTLIFSSFRPVHIFGFTVFTGILIAYITALISRRQ